YWARVASRNSTGALAWSQVIAARTLASDKSAPKKVLGLNLDITPDNKLVMLNWSPVLYDVTGATENLAGYNVYRSSVLAQDYARRNSVPIIPTIYSEPYDAQSTYYKVLAVDQAGNESDDSFIVDTSKNAYSLAVDRVSNIKMPQDILQQNKNQFKADLDISSDTVASQEFGPVIRSMRFSAVRSDTNEIIKDFILSKPEIEIMLHYSIVAGKVANGFAPKNAPASVSPDAVSATAAPESLSMYWFDGIKWVKLGGRVDVARQTLSVKTAHAGQFQIRSVARPTEFRMDSSGQSHKIITPNGDGWNDSVIFRFENPKTVEVTGKVFDLTGAFVGSMKQGPEENTLLWDGTDGEGRVARGGIYIFQIEAAGKVFSGTVVVAR
ncbi:MAG: hypothetical protein AAB091_02540, partial [Elusimicrobiota bacterium]